MGGSVWGRNMVKGKCAIERGMTSGCMSSTCMGGTKNAGDRWEGFMVKSYPR